MQANQVLVAQRMHGVHLSDEIIQAVRVQHVSLQTLHRHGQLEPEQVGQTGANCHLKEFIEITLTQLQQISKFSKC